MKFYTTPKAHVKEAIPNVCGLTIIHQDLKIEEFNFPADDSKNIMEFDQEMYLTAYDDEDDRYYVLNYPLPDEKRGEGYDGIEISLKEVLG